MTMMAKLVIAVVVAAVLAGGAFFYFTLPAAAPGGEEQVQSPTSSQPTPPSPAPSPAPAPDPAPGPTTYTMAQVALHASASSCWTVIRGSVYDLTVWIPQHPGGPDKILQLCGKDGTDKFVGQHGGSAKQEEQLATFKIGILAQ